MEDLFHERSLQNDTESSCSSKTCSSCLKEDGCSWCNGNANSSGSCQLLGNPQPSCRQAFTTDGSHCPSVGADVSTAKQYQCACAGSQRAASKKNCLYFYLEYLRTVSSMLSARLVRTKTKQVLCTRYLVRSSSTYDLTGRAPELQLPCFLFSSSCSYIRNSIRCCSCINSCSRILPSTTRNHFI